MAVVPNSIRIAHGASMSADPPAPVGHNYDAALQRRPEMLRPVPGPLVLWLSSFPVAQERRGAHEHSDVLLTSRLKRGIRADSLPMMTANGRVFESRKKEAVP